MTSKEAIKILYAKHNNPTFVKVYKDGDKIVEEALRQVKEDLEELELYRKLFKKTLLGKNITVVQGEYVFDYGRYNFAALTKEEFELIRNIKEKNNDK